jgi:hypothetical protein
LAQSGPLPRCTEVLPCYCAPRFLFPFSGLTP